MNKVISFNERKQAMADKENRKKELNIRQEELIDKLDDDNLEIGQWEDMVEEIQENQKELNELNNEAEDDDDFEIVFDKGLKSRNSAMDAIETARKNGINISEEDLAKIFN